MFPVELPPNQPVFLYFNILNACIILNDVNILQYIEPIDECSLIISGY